MTARFGGEVVQTRTEESLPALSDPCLSHTHTRTHTEASGRNPSQQSKEVEDRAAKASDSQGDERERVRE